MRYVDVENGSADAAEGASYPVDATELSKAGVAMVVFPGNDEPWIEREPFQGREHDEALIAIAEGLLAEAERQLVESSRPPTPEEELEQWRQSVSVSAFQAEQALADFDLLDAVEVWLENDAGETERRAWRRAQEWRYTSPTIEAACQALGITPEQKDALFKHAETIEA